MVSVEIVVNILGVERIRYIGGSLDDEPEARQLYDRIRHLVLEIDRTLKDDVLKLLDKTLEE